MITNRKAFVTLLAVSSVTLVLSGMLNYLSMDPPVGSIEVMNLPADARITIDDGPALKPNLLGRVLVHAGPGTHRLVMTRPGRQPVEVCILLEEQDFTIVALPEADPQPAGG